jgi:hypothetical protein
MGKTWIFSVKTHEMQLGVRYRQVALAGEAMETAF